MFLGETAVAAAGTSVFFGTLDRIPSHIASPAVMSTPISVNPPAVGLASNVLTTNSVSPSSAVEKGWIARAIDVWTCTASLCKAEMSIRRLTTTKPIVVLVVGAGGDAIISDGSRPDTSKSEAVVLAVQWGFPGQFTTLP